MVFSLFGKVMQKKTKTKNKAENKTKTLKKHNYQLPIINTCTNLDVKVQPREKL